MFTEVEVNKFVVSWITKGLEGRTFSICNSSICQTYKYLKNGHFMIIKEERPPKKHKFKNAPNVGGGGGGGGGGQPTDPIGSIGSGPSLPPGCYGDCPPDGTVTVGPIEDP